MMELGMVALLVTLGVIFLSWPFVHAHDRCVLIRTWMSNRARIASGSLFVLWPEYVVSDAQQLGPWRKLGFLPLVGQLLEIDVPEVVVMVERGLYSLKVNTKVVGVVQSYTVDDLTKNATSVESRIHDIIATTLRKAVHDLTLQDALAEIQRIFSKDHAAISTLITIPAFKGTHLMMDPTESITANNEMTQSAMDQLALRHQEAEKRKLVEESMVTEEKRVKLRRIALQSHREELQLQAEIYGKEGAAMVEAAKHAKALYLGLGSSQPGWLHVDK